MTFWLVLIALSCLALTFVVWPLYRSSGRLTPLLATVIVFTVALSAVLYTEIGQPDATSGAGVGDTALSDVSAMVDALAKRLETEPDDIEGWVMLARSYGSMGRFDEAIEAFEMAVDLEEGSNPQTLIGLAITLIEGSNGEMSARADSLFENALELDPNNQNALFYAGGAAARRGDTALAADRWERLLNQDAPPEISELLKRKISEWRGIPNAPLEPAAVIQEQDSDAIVSVNVSLSPEAAAALTADSTVYLIARDPAQPSPPIAVVPKRLSDLPETIDLSDTNAMISGRPLSGFSTFEVVARVSLSGSPAAQSGDWFGTVVFNSGDESVLRLAIDQMVP